ncbi:MAG: 4'-phosphopantetheinyl transferase superfamily protein [Saprospiraceae bacterium]
MNILHKIILGNTTVAVGHHTGNDIDPEKMLFEKEMIILQQLSPRKRSEWLASRELLFQIARLPERAECLYDDFGKPYLKDTDKLISVSHSELWCAAMISNRSCGVDVQTYTSTVERIANRFLSGTELADIGLQSNKNHYLHVYWGAKECMYKAYGKRRLEFKSHIYIHAVHAEQGTALGEIRYEDLHLTYDIHYRILPETAWVFCIQRPDSTDSADSRM